MMLNKSPTYPSEEVPGDAVSSQFPSPYSSTPESLAHGLQHCTATTAQKSKGFHGPPHSAPDPQSFQQMPTKTTAG